MTAVPEALHTRFLQLLPKIKTHAQIAFRHIPCCHRREDAVQEVCCLGWKWFTRLVERGKDAEDFPMAFAELLARAVRSGRRLVGMNKAKDPMNPLTQRREGFTVELLETLVQNGTTSGQNPRPKRNHLQPPAVNWYTCLRTSYTEVKDGSLGQIFTHPHRSSGWHGR